MHVRAYVCVRACHTIKVCVEVFGDDEYRREAGPADLTRAKHPMEQGH